MHQALPRHLEYRQYYLALGHIARGLPVDHLDILKRNCDEVFTRNHDRLATRQYNMDWDVVHIIATAENRILHGEPVAVVYEGFFNPVNAHEESRARLESLGHEIYPM